MNSRIYALIILGLLFLVLFVNIAHSIVCDYYIYNGTTNYINKNGIWCLASDIYCTNFKLVNINSTVNVTIYGNNYKIFGENCRFEVVSKNSSIKLMDIHGGVYIGYGDYNKQLIILNSSIERITEYDSPEGSAGNVSIINSTIEEEIYLGHGSNRIIVIKNSYIFTNNIYYGVYIVTDELYINNSNLYITHAFNGYNGFSVLNYGIINNSSIKITKLTDSSGGDESFPIKNINISFSTFVFEDDDLSLQNVTFYYSNVIFYNVSSVNLPKSKFLYSSFAFINAKGDTTPVLSTTIHSSTIEFTNSTFIISYTNILYIENSTIIYKDNISKILVTYSYDGFACTINIFNSKIIGGKYGIYFDKICGSPTGYEGVVIKNTYICNNEEYSIYYAGTSSTYKIDITDSYFDEVYPNVSIIEIYPDHNFYCNGTSRFKGFYLIIKGTINNSVIYRTQVNTTESTIINIQSNKHLNLDDVKLKISSLILLKYNFTVLTTNDITNMYVRYITEQPDVINPKKESFKWSKISNTQMSGYIEYSSPGDIGNVYIREQVIGLQYWYHYNNVNIYPYRYNIILKIRGHYNSHLRLDAWIPFYSKDIYGASIWRFHFVCKNSTISGFTLSYCIDCGNNLFNYWKNEKLGNYEQLFKSTSNDGIVDLSIDVSTWAKTFGCKKISGFFIDVITPYWIGSGGSGIEALSTTNQVEILEVSLPHDTLKVSSSVNIQDISLITEIPYDSIITNCSEIEKYIELSNAQYLGNCEWKINSSNVFISSSIPLMLEYSITGNVSIIVPFIWEKEGISAYARYYHNLNYVINLTEVKLLNVPLQVYKFIRYKYDGNYPNPHVVPTNVPLGKVIGIGNETGIYIIEPKFWNGRNIENEKIFDVILGNGTYTYTSTKDMAIYYFDPNDGGKIQNNENYYVILLFKPEVNVWIDKIYYSNIRSYIIYTTIKSSSNVENEVKVLTYILHNDIRYNLSLHTIYIGNNSYNIIYDNIERIVQKILESVNNNTAIKYCAKIINATYNNDTSDDFKCIDIYLNKSWNSYNTSNKWSLSVIVKDALNDTLVDNATVRIEYYNGTLFTQGIAVNGTFNLTNLTESTYYISVSKEGYQTYNTSVLLDEDKTVIIYLIPLNLTSKYNLTVLKVFTMTADNIPIGNATVCIYYQNGTLFECKKSSDDGIALFLIKPNITVYGNASIYRLGHWYYGKIDNITIPVQGATVFIRFLINGTDPIYGSPLWSKYYKPEVGFINAYLNIPFGRNDAYHPICYSIFSTEPRTVYIKIQLQVNQTGVWTTYKEAIVKYEFTSYQQTIKDCYSFYVKLSNNSDVRGYLEIINYTGSDTDPGNNHIYTTTKQIYIPVSCGIFLVPLTKSELYPEDTYSLRILFACTTKLPKNNILVSLNTKYFDAIKRKTKKTVKNITIVPDNETKVVYVNLTVAWTDKIYHSLKYHIPNNEVTYNETDSLSFTVQPAIKLIELKASEVVRTDTFNVTLKYLANYKDISYSMILKVDNNTKSIGVTSDYGYNYNNITVKTTLPSFFEIQKTITITIESDDSARYGVKTLSVSVIIVNPYWWFIIIIILLIIALLVIRKILSVSSSKMIKPKEEFKYFKVRRK